MAKLFGMGPSPHIRTKESVESVMYDVVIALIPALIAAIAVFGRRAILVTSVSILTCVVTEYICQKMLKQDITALDGSAVLTGILFAFVIPVDMWIPYIIAGSFVSIVLGKMVFGGLGGNIFNPALVGRAFVQASWPAAITTFTMDGKAGATMLSAIKLDLLNNSDVVLLVSKEGNQLLNIFLGKMGGCLGETSALALLIGGVYLIIKKQIDWVVPVIMIGTVGVISYLVGENPIVQILSGGLFLGAFFMATDMVTSPYTRKGRAIFAFGIGILVSLIRFKGGYPEGVAYSILIMNGVVPLIDRYIKPKKFGGAKKNEK